MSLLASLRDEAKIMELSRLGTKHVHEVHSIVDEIARFAGDAAIGALAKFPDDGGGTGEIPTDLAKAIASIGSRRAAEALATRLDDKAVRPVALAFFASRIHLAVPALARAVMSRGNAAEAA